MQKIGSCGGEQFAPATLINQEKPVEEEEDDEMLLRSRSLKRIADCLRLLRLLTTIWKPDLKANRP